MKKHSPLEHVKRLIKKLSSEDKQQIVPYLAQLPDGGVQSYDLTEEFEALKKHGQVLPPEGSPDGVSLVFIRDLVEVRVADRKVAHARFFPKDFEEAFPSYINQIEKTAGLYKEQFLEPDTKAKIYAQRAANGIIETEAECEAAIIAWCDDTAKVCVPERAKRTAERISRHFPGMVADMIIAAIKGQTFYDLVEMSKAFGKDIPSSQPIKKAVQDIAWRDLKPHLPSTRHSRTPPDWRTEETVKRYAQQVTDRKALATRIREVYEECDHAPGWMEDLKTDSTFERLSVGVPKDALDWAMKRVASDERESDSRERQAVSIALEMARRELGLTELDIETLRNKNDEGNKLLKADRLKKKPDDAASGI